MNRVKGSTQTERENSSGRKLPKKAITIAAAAIILIIILLILEAINSNRYAFRNNTGTDIESLVLYFENADENFYYRSDNLVECAMKAGEKRNGRFEPLSSAYMPGSFLIIEVKFEGRDKVMLYSGYFTNSFSGKINLVFDEDSANEGNITVAIKAGEGLFQSTRSTDCDETQDLFLED